MDDVLIHFISYLYQICQVCVVNFIIFTILVFLIGQSLRAILREHDQLLLTDTIILMVERFKFELVIG